jgi:hypothetical protein
MDKAVFGIARNESAAVNITDRLKTAGFSPNDISVLLPDKTGTRDFAHEQHTKAPEGAATGAGGGVVIGGALGWLAGIGALVISGVGPFIAAGPFMAALAGAGAGAAAGGVVCVKFSKKVIGMRGSVKPRARSGALSESSAPRLRRGQAAGRMISFLCSRSSSMLR